MKGRAIIGLALASACVFGLAGCKVQSATQINLSDLQDSSFVETSSYLRLEVPSCDSYEDSRQPSKSLIEAQESIPRIFPGAEYSDCFSQQFTSWAQFVVPVGVDHSDDGQPVTSETFSLLSPDGRSLFFQVPQALKQRIAEAEDQPMAPSLEFDIRLRLTNDSGEDIQYLVISSWADQEAISAGGRSLSAGEDLDLKLSDVSVDEAMNNGTVMVLSHTRQ